MNLTPGMSVRVSSLCGQENAAFSYSIKLHVLCSLYVANFIYCTSLNDVWYRCEEKTCVHIQQEG